MTCRVLAFGLLVLTYGASAHAQGSSVSPTRETLAVGVALSPAIEGGSPWLLAGARANSRISDRFGLGIAADRIWGSKNKFSEITEGYGAQLMLFSAKRAYGSASYWFFGPQFLRGVDIDGQTGARRSEVHTAGTVGRGWSQLAGRSRVAGEIAFSGGDGFLLSASLVVQFAAVK